MELKNEFRVSVPIDVAWAVLTDLERVAPCMPGAELQEVEGDEYRGVVKVKVGPITAQYKGTARFLEKDDALHRAVLRAEGRDTRGQGNASATVVATATPDEGGTLVSIETDLSITGKVAQFGRSIMGDISTKMLGEFADRLEADVRSEGSGPKPEGESAGAPVPNTGEAAATPETSSVRTVHSTPAEPVNLLGTAGPSILKRAAPLAAVVAVLLLLWRRRRH
jgi:carbon monoxide dehydrogenase subunit G